MTAEIAVLNKLGVALAADSIVTVTTARDTKTYNSSNKLFTLSKYQPVGVLTYGATEIDSMPFEIIIKEYRRRLNVKPHKTIEKYGDTLVKSIPTIVPPTPEKERRNYHWIADDHADTLRQNFRSECQENKIRLASRFTPEMTATFNTVLARFQKISNDEGKYPAFAALQVSDAVAAYPGVIDSAVKRHFGRYGPSASQQDALRDAIAERMLSNGLSYVSCGFVIAGYGEDQMYPALIEYDADGTIFGSLKIIKKQEFQVTDATRSAILPFAQDDAAGLFVNGVDETYQQFINEGIEDLLPGLADIAAQQFGVTAAADIDKLRQDLVAEAAGFIEKMSKRRERDFSNRLHNSIEMLDKEELGTLAENLVGLTALKQKISPELESVGGPIDVAVISRHDGFIWIKRKHYFKPELNPFFFRNYLK